MTVRTVSSGGGGGNQSAAATGISPPIQNLLARLTRRIRLLRVLRGSATGALFGAFATLTYLLLVRLRLLDPDTTNDYLLLLPPLLGLLLGAGRGVSRPVPPLAALRLGEQRLDLKERLSTAYAFAPVVSGNEDNLLARQIADADRAAASAPTNIADILPFRPLPRVVWAALSACAAAFLLWFLPTLPLFQSPAQRAEHAAVQKEGERLVRIVKALEAKAGNRKLDSTRRAAAKLALLGKEMQRGKMSQRKAMMRTAKLTEEMKQAQQAIAKEGMPQKSLAAASRDLAKAIKAAGQSTPQTSEGKEQSGLKAPQNSDGQSNRNTDRSANAKTPASSEAMKKLLDAMAQNNAPSLAEQLAKLADKAAEGEPRDTTERQKMAEQLSALAKALEKTRLSPASPSLEKAAEALKKADLKEAEKELREAARRASEAQKSGEEKEALQQMADAVSGTSGGGDDNTAEDPAAAMADSGKGQGADDAFGKDGALKGKKGHVHTAECLKPGGTCAGESGQGKSAQGIGSGAGKLGGKKPPTEKWSPYQDARDAPKNNKDLNRATQTNEVRNDKWGRLYAPDGKMANTRVTGKRGEKGKETISYFRGAPDKVSAKVPYYEVYSQYAPAAESALNREDIPSSYKKQVKDYFDALNPGKGGSSRTGDRKP